MALYRESGVSDGASTHTLAVSWGILRFSSLSCQHPFPLFRCAQVRGAQQDRGGVGAMGMGGKRTVGKRHCHLEQAAGPYSLVLARDATFPYLQVENTLCVTLGFRVEAEGVILPPLLSVHARRPSVSLGAGGGE